MRRRPLFAVAAALAALLVLELLSRLAEGPLALRALPDPTPGTDLAFEAAAEADAASLPGLPMVKEDATTWGLPKNRVVRTGRYEARINGLGLRGPDLGPLVPGERRLLTLGDSTIFGDLVPESQVFSSVACARLGCTPVIGAVPGHDSGQSRAQLEKIGATVRPAWVVVGNLWSDVYRAPPPPSPANVVTARLQDVGVRTATYRVFRLLLAPLLPSKKVGFIDGAADVGTTGSTRTPLDQYAGNLRTMATQAQRLGARVVFLVLPAPIDLGEGGPPETVRAFRAAMCEVAKEADAPCIDGPAWFRAHGATIGYFEDQVHPGPHGHRLLGEALAEALSR